MVLTLKKWFKSSFDFFTFFGFGFDLFLFASVFFSIMLPIKNLHLSLILNCSTFSETNLKTASSGLVSRRRNDCLFLYFAIVIKSCLHEELRREVISLTSPDLRNSVVSCIQSVQCRSSWYKRDILTTAEWWRKQRLRYLYGSIETSGSTCNLHEYVGSEKINYNRRCWNKVIPGRTEIVIWSKSEIDNWYNNF